MIYSVLIVDDEEHIRSQLEYIIGTSTLFQVCASCSNGTEALDKIMTLNPSIVLLDIRMSGIDGIKLGNILDRLKEKSPYVIYVTAYEEYAVKAMNIGARGYILKPFSDEDVLSALLRGVEALDKKRSHTLHPLQTKVATYDEDKILFFNQSDIIMAVAKKRKVYMNVGDAEYISRYSLTELEKKLDSEMFFRSHRNYLINLQKVDNIAPWFNNSYIIHLKENGKQFEVPLSRDNVKKFKMLMNF